MHGDFRPLVNAGTMSDDIVIEGTRAYRLRIHEAIRASNNVPWRTLPFHPTQRRPPAQHPPLSTQPLPRPRWSRR